MRERRTEECQGQEEMVFLFLDGELSPLEHAAFAAHLQGCPACQALVDQWAHFSASLAVAEELPPPPELAEGVMARIAQEPPPRAADRLGELILGAQLLVGLGLLLLFGPSLLKGLAPWLGVGQSLDGQLSLRFWQGFLALVRGVISWRPLPRLPSPGILSPTDWFTLSSQVGLILVVALGLAWLLGNALLLGPTSGKGRGPFSRAR